MVSSSELAAPRRPDFLLLGAHPAIDFANTFVPPPGLNLEFLQSWRDVIDWLKETRLSDGQNLEVSESDAPQALEAVRNLRHAWRITLEAIMAGHAVQPQFIKQLNRILCLDTFRETLGVEGKNSFHLHRSRSLLETKHLALATIARSIAQFLITAELKYLHRCANTDSCALVFYDTTKNHRRQWCSNSMCGNRFKVAQFRQRQRAEEKRSHSEREEKPAHSEHKPVHRTQE
jgi:predicted RNA-binding Zn ribbon-like protein